MEELIVRIQALLDRRAKEEQSQEPIDIGDYKFDRASQTLHHPAQSQPFQLTHRESELLAVLVQNKNQLTDRTMILESLWGNDDFFNARSMDVFISKLRKKFTADETIQILNVRGYGYKLVC